MNSEERTQATCPYCQTHPRIVQLLPGSEFYGARCDKPCGAMYPTRYRKDVEWSVENERPLNKGPRPDGRTPQPKS